MFARLTSTFEKITPHTINRWGTVSLPLWIVGLLITLPLGLYYGLIASPADYQQGDSVRIMYIHVPSAYIATSFYTLLAVSSIGVLVWRSPVSEIIARASAPLGLIASILMLITGAIWGQPTWGTWWVWDARLTSSLLLAFLYIAYIATACAYDDVGGRGKPAAILAVVGFINIPIIRFSVEWWNTLHQPASLIRVGGTSIDGSMLKPLLYMLVAFTCFFTILLVLRVQIITNRRKINTLRQQHVRGL